MHRSTRRWFLAPSLAMVLGSACTGGGDSGGTQPPTAPVQVAERLVVVSAPNASRDRAVVTSPFIVEVQDSSGRAVANWTTPVSATLVDGRGSLAGTTTAPTTAARATFQNLAISGTGPFTIRFSSGALRAADVALLVVADVVPIDTARLIAVPDSTKEQQGIYTYQVVGQPVSLDSGKIIVGTSGEGYLRRVVRTSRQGNLLIAETVQATLEELGPSGTVRDSVAIDLTGVVPRLTGPYAHPLQGGAPKVSYKDGTIIADDIAVVPLASPSVVIEHIEIAVRPYKVTSIDLTNGTVNRVDFEIGGTVSYKVDYRVTGAAAAAVNGSVPLFCLAPPSVPIAGNCPGWPLPPIPIPLGPLPPLLVPNSLVLGIDLTGSMFTQNTNSVRKHAEGSTTFRTGVSYVASTQTLTPLGSVTSAFVSGPLAMGDRTSNAGFKLGPTLSAKWRIAGVTGPYASMGVAVKWVSSADATSRTQTEVCKVAIDRTAGVFLNIIRRVSVVLPILQLPEVELLEFCRNTTPFPPPAAPRLFAASIFQGFGSQPPSDLYRVDATPSGADQRIGRIRTAQGFEPGITDMALDRNGTLWGVSFDRLYRIDTLSALATEVGPTGLSDVNALASRQDGSLYAATLAGSLVRLNTQNAAATIVGTLGSGFRSWGDVAFSLEDRLYATLLSRTGAGVLATIDPTTGVATLVSPTNVIGFDNVWGLAFSSSRLFGLTTDGNGRGTLLELDPRTGIATFVRALGFNAGGAGRVAGRRGG